MTSQNFHPPMKQDLNHLEKWFSDYVRSFYSLDPLIQKTIALKEDHSLRVCNEILNIGKQLDLSSANLELARVMALFHDIGRFEQFIRYGTFADGKSENHAELGVKILRKEKTLAALDDEAQELILKVISYHNRMNIPENESRVCIFFARLLRDADKLDIFNLFADYYAAPEAERSAAVELDLPDIPAITDEIMAGLMEGKMVGMRQLKSLNDFKLLQMAWIYDINFQPTFRIIAKRGYLDIIRRTLPDSESIDQIYHRLLRYLKERSECGDARHP